MNAEIFFEEWGKMCLNNKGCRCCPAREVKEHGYLSCCEWVLLNYHEMIEYVKHWREYLYNETCGSV